MQPTPYSPSANFAQDEANGVSGRSSVKTSLLDAQFSSLATTLGQVLSNLALIQRDDGALLDAVVRVHTLSSDVLTLMASTTFKVRGSWVGGTTYAKGDVVLQNAIVYVCFVAHTANVFATDLAAGDWGALTTSSNASTTSFAPTTTIAATTVQAAIQELDNEVRPAGAILLHELCNGL